MKSNELTLGIDLGGTKVSLGLVDKDGNLGSTILIKTSKESPIAVVKDIAAAAKQLDLRSSKIVAAGVGMAGQIGKDANTVFHAPNLGWKNFTLGKELSNHLGVPVRVTNDVRAAALGEWLYGAGKGVSDLVCIFVGTGIGGAIVSGGKMLVGNGNAAGEIGHTTIDIHGSMCSCGNRGCFETLAGGWAIARRAREVLAYDEVGGRALLAMVEGKLDAITASHVFAAYREKVSVAMKVIEEVKEGLIAGVANIVNTFNPARVILGGGIINGNVELIDVIRLGVTRRALKVSTENLAIIQAALHGDAGVIGSAAFVHLEG